jgi:hypothetical protein
MNANDDDSESDSAEKKDYSFVGRFAVFLFIAGPASVLAFGLYGRIAFRNSLSAALQNGDYTPMIIPALWLFGLAGTAIMIFKK